MEALRLYHGTNISLTFTRKRVCNGENRNRCTLWENAKRVCLWCNLLTWAEVTEKRSLEKVQGRWILNKEQCIFDWILQQITTLYLHTPTPPPHCLPPSKAPLPPSSVSHPIVFLCVYFPRVSRPLCIHPHHYLAITCTATKTTTTTIFALPNRRHLIDFLSTLFPRV